MNIKNLNQKIRLLALGDYKELVIFINNIENNLTNLEKLELYTIGAMYASSSGCFENLKFMVKKMPEILLEKDQGILRMTVDIKDFNNFKKVINFLLEYSEKIDFNARENSWLKECIKNGSLDKIEYVIENVRNLEINNNIIKTLVRNKNKEMFDYFIFNLDLKNNHSLENWLIENNHEKELEIIKKRDLFNNLDKDLIVKPNKKMRKI